jgi:hypothetical protein
MIRRGTLAAVQTEPSVNPRLLRSFSSSTERLTAFWNTALGTASAY